MEKYAKLLKGLEKCAGPECCKDGCPYYNTTTGGMTCRARLLLDANIAITNEQARAVEAEEQLQDTKEALDTVKAEYEALEESARSVSAHRDAIDRDREEVYQHRNRLIKENEVLQGALDNLGKAHQNLCTVRDALAAENKALHNEIDALVLKMGGKQDGKTDRPSVCSDDLAEKCETYRAEANYWTGRAEGLLEVIKTLFGAEKAPADE